MWAMIQALDGVLANDRIVFLWTINKQRGLLTGAVINLV